MSLSMAEFFDGLSSTWDSGQTLGESDLLSYLSLLPIKEGDKVLDLACGTGVITALLAQMTKQPVLGLDLSPKMIEVAQKKYGDNPMVHFESGDFLSFSGKGYDMVVLYNAYPHFLDPKALSNKLASVLGPKGRFAILHSLSREELSAHHAGKAHPYSRDLLPVSEEAAFFEQNFKILDKKEGKHLFLLTGEKRF